MTFEERKNAITEIKQLKKFENQETLSHYTSKQIWCGIFAGLGVASYIVLKSTEPIANIEALPIEGYIQETSIWVRNELLPKLRNFPELLETLKINNGLEAFTASITALLAGTSAWQIHKRASLKRKMSREVSEEIKALGR